MSRRKSRAPETPALEPAGTQLSEPRSRHPLVPFFLAVFCVVLAFALRLTHFYSLPQFNPNDDTALFSTEDALQFRYARMVAGGGTIPAVDPALHYPEGFAVRENLTTLVEQFEGSLYPLLGSRVPLHVFLVCLVCLVSSLGVLGAYGVAASLWKSRWAGAVAAFLYAVGVPTYVRIIGGYGTEHFALPLLFGGIWAVLAALNDAEARPWSLPVRAFLAGALFAGALAAWHLSRFFFSLFLAVLVAVWLFLKLSGNTEGEKFSGLILWLLGPVVAVSLIVPILQSRPFWSAPLFLLSAAIPVAQLLARARSPRVQVGVWFGVGLLLVFAAARLAPAETGYSHVWGILAAKVANLGVKPSDPARLPFALRAVWIEEVHSPRFGTFLITFGLLPLLAVCGIVVGRSSVRGAESLPGKLLFGGLTLGSIAAYLAFERMIGFAAFFLVVLAAGAISAPRPMLLCLVLCVLAETHRSVFYAAPAAWKSAVAATFPLPGSAVPTWHENATDLLAWIRRNTREGEAFLARMGISGTIVTYTDRPVVLQSKMENREIWPRLEGFLSALYGPEQAFDDYCRRHQVRYFLYEAAFALDSTLDSERFTAGSPQLQRDSTAYLCHFRPETLQHLTLVYQDSYYRLFRVEPSGSHAKGPELPYQPTYDLRLYGDQSGDVFRDAGTPPVMARLSEARGRLDAARALLGARRPADALREARRALELNPGIQGLRVTLALALGVMGNEAEGIPILEEEVRFFPDEVLARYYLGLYLVKAGRQAEGARQWEEGLRRDPENAPILTARKRYLNVP